MNMEFTLTHLLTIISMICSIPAILVSIRTLKTCKDIECKLKNEENIEEFDHDEYLHSLEFNTKLDNMIVPLLGKESNNEIVKTVLLRIYKEDPKTDKITGKKLEDYVRDILRNYNNPYNMEKIYEFLDEDKKDNYLHTTITNIKSEGASDGVTPVKTDLTNTLNNFYKD